MFPQELTKLVVILYFKFMIGVLFMIEFVFWPPIFFIQSKKFFVLWIILGIFFHLFWALFTLLYYLIEIGSFKEVYIKREKEIHSYVIEKLFKLLIVRPPTFIFKKYVLHLLSQEKYLNTYLSPSERASYFMQQNDDPYAIFIGLKITEAEQKLAKKQANSFKNALANIVKKRNV